MVLDIYKQSKKFPKEEIFGLISQIRRAVISITANIAEGMGRHSYKERVRFFYNSRGSLYEVKGFILLANDLNYLTEEEFNNLDIKTTKIMKILSGLIRSTERLSQK